MSVSPRTNSQYYCVYQLNILANIFKEFKEVEIIPTSLMIARKNRQDKTGSERERGARKGSVRRKRVDDIEDGGERRNNSLVQAFRESNLPGTPVMSLNCSA